MKRKRLILPVILCILMIGALFAPISVYAIADPDDMDILSMNVYRNLLENGDRLFLFTYELEYAVYPTDYNVNQAFIFSLYATDGVTLLGSALAYPYWHDAPGDAYGYGQGVISFYFPDAAGVAPLFNEAYILTIDGNPVVFGAPPSEDFTINPTNYTSLTDSEENKLSLGNQVQSIAEDLETAWGLTLLDTQEGDIFLSSYGEEYFVNAIYGLRALAPSLFYVQTVSMDMSRRTWTMNYADALAAGTADTEGTTIDGSLVETGLEAGGNLIGGNKMLFGSIIVVGIIVAVMAFCVQNLKTMWLGWTFSTLIMAGGVRLSMVHMSVIAIFGLFSVVLLAWTVFGSKTG